MSDTTIPDALCDDLKNWFLSSAPEGLGVFDSNRVRLKHALGEAPCPRIQIISGDGRRIPRQDFTQRIPVELGLITSLEATTPEAHRFLAGKLSAWWEDLRLLKGLSASPFVMTFHHDMLISPPVTSRDNEHEEQVTTFRAEFVVTLKGLL